MSAQSSRFAERRHVLEQGAGRGIAIAVAGCWRCRSAGGVAPCNTRRRSAKQQDFKSRKHARAWLTYFGRAGHQHKSWQAVILPCRQHMRLRCVLPQVSTPDGPRVTLHMSDGIRLVAQAESTRSLIAGSPAHVNVFEHPARATTLKHVK